MSRAAPGLRKGCCCHAKASRRTTQVGWKDGSLEVTMRTLLSAEDCALAVRQKRFAVWLLDEDLVIPRVDLIAVRVADDDVTLVPTSALPSSPGTRASRSTNVSGWCAPCMVATGHTW
jgi:hypothetical protein